MMSGPLTAKSSKKDDRGVCCLTFVWYDSLRLSNFSPGLLERFQQELKTLWQQGIQREGYNREQNSYYIKLRGYPWSSPFSASPPGKVTGVMRSSRLLLGLSRFMLTQGWAWEFSMSGAQIYDHAWFFTKTKEKTERYPVMCCIAFSKHDKIRVVDGRPEVLETVQSSITNHWRRGLTKQTTYEGAHEFKLFGVPWGALIHRAEADILLLRLRLALKNVGWTIYSTIEFRNLVGHGSVETCSTWILKKSGPDVTNQ